MKINYALHPFVDISNHSIGFEIVSISNGFDNRIYVLLVDTIPERIEGMFVQSETSQTFFLSS